MIFKVVRGVSMLALVLGICACGGGDSSGGGGNGGGVTPPAVNQAPRFNSATTASVREGSLPAYQAQASDPEGGAITYSIAGGEDAARFTINAAGALFFAAAPDFEAPADANRDNVYLVQIAASDGQLSTSLAVQITVTDDGLFRVKRVATGLADPRTLIAIPGDARLFVTEKTGRILFLDPATGATDLFINAANVLDPISGAPRNAISTDGDRGLLGLAPSPDYQSSGVVFGAVTNPAGDLEIRRFSRAANNPNQFAAITVLTVPHPASTTNYGGWIGFGSDSNLYIATGDGGGRSDPQANAQNPNSRLGKILRAAPNPDPFAGASPNYNLLPVAGNPYFSGGGDRFVYALGFHDPRTASFSATGLLIGDRGQDLAEEIDLLRILDLGGNYGWPFREGTFAAAGGGAAPGNLINPVLQYGRGGGATQGGGVVAGPVYRGSISTFAGLYFFADSVTGSIWTVPASSLQQGQTLSADSFTRRNADLVPDAGQIDRIVSFGEDNAGNLYIVDGDGEVFVLQAR